MRKEMMPQFHSGWFIIQHLASHVSSEVLVSNLEKSVLRKVAIGQLA